jgi:2-oxoglutarate ferredoxin oxidoreductase subunit beta
MNTAVAPERKDYLSGIDPRWCPGCGDYGVLKSFTQALAQLAIPREKIAVISGIGCSSRFPHYVQSYGFHGIHGRAPALALGLKLTRPELSVWVVTGDGDGLSIGGNHFIHLMRRNPDIKVILLNNRIYALTKGQLSPTSPKGHVSKSTPYGSVESPINPVSLAIACGATFVARVPGTDNAMTTEVMVAAAKHKGVALIEVLQDCDIFNQGIWTELTKKSNRAERTVMLKHGEPLVWGEKQDKGFRVKGFELEKVDLNDKSVNRAELLVHDVYRNDPTLALKLSMLDYPADPYPLGIFRSVEAPIYETEVSRQEHEVAKKIGKSDIYKLLHTGETWDVPSEDNWFEMPV